MTTRVGISRRRAKVSEILLAVLRRFPADMLSVVKSELRPVGTLDYAPSHLEMCLNSPWQVYRLRSSQKEPETVRWLEEELRVGDCFFDIGANVGAYSLVAFAITRGQARVVAFEPGFGTFAELCRNIQLNQAQSAIVPLPIALGAQTRLAGLEYSDTTPGAALHRWHEADARTAAPPNLVLQTVSWELDPLIEALELPLPSLIKLDVDGSELDVLKGARATLAHPSLRGCLVELDERSEASAQAEALLAENGFRVRSRHLRGDTGPFFNVIFSRS